MAAMQVGIVVDSSELQAAFKRAPELFKRELVRLIEGGAIDVQRRMRELVNVGATGETRQAIRYKIRVSQLEAEIRPYLPDERVSALEYGSDPHWVSVGEGSSLAKWATFRGINKYAVQRSIAAKGTKAHPFIEPTYSEMNPLVFRDIATGISQLVRRYSDGRV